METKDSNTNFMADENNKMIYVPIELLNDEIFSLEYSKTQNAFHIDTVSHIVKQNFEELFILERTNDYKIIFIGSRVQCQELKNQIQQAKAEFNPES